MKKNKPKNAEKMQLFAKRLLLLRNRHLLTQQELAESSRVSLRSIQIWEKGKTNLPNPSLMRRLCAALNVTPEQMFQGETDPSVPSTDKPTVPEWLSHLYQRLSHMAPERRQRIVAVLESVCELSSSQLHPTPSNPQSTPP